MIDFKPMLEDKDGQAMAKLSDYVNPAFAKVLKLIGFDVNFVKGIGAHLFDDQGNRYIDCLGGYGTFGCGRNHPKIREAMKQLMDLDPPNLIKMGIPKLSGELARQLCELAPGDMGKVFFCNGGADAVESALKFARAATGRDRIVHCKKSFHGLTIGALSLNGGWEFRQGFGQLLEPITMIPYSDLEALEAELSKKDVAAFIVEPIQGKGVNIPSDEFLPGAVALCHQYGSIFIADEVQTGLGRTGKWFACEHWHVEPDIICVAKTLSGGFVPVGATICKDWIHKKTFSSLDRCVVHSTTFGENDYSMAAGLATIDVMKEEKLVENAAAMGSLLLDQLGSLVDKYEMLKEVRGKGLMTGVAFAEPRSLKLQAGWKLIHKVDQSLFPQAIIMPLMSDYRVLTQVAGHHQDVIKMIPPLVLDEQDVDDLAKAFDAVISKCHRFPGPMWEIGKRMSEAMVKSAIS